jgi:hypothetical protein
MRISTFIDDDDVEEMEVDNDFGEMPLRQRQNASENNLLQPGQRGANHNEMFQHIQQGINYR